MKSSNIEKLEWQFFSELKKYNYTNYMDLKRADLTQDNAKVHKAFSSTVTRYFIFREKHADIPSADLNQLFYQLKIDLIAKYFSQYPDADIEPLKDFQVELNRYENSKEETKV